MDYETFTTRFPSTELLARFGITEAAFKKRYIKTFNRHGFVSVGLTDVSIGKLEESGAITTGWFGRLKIVPEKLDITPVFRRQVGGEFHRFQLFFSTLVHRMQDGIYPMAAIKAHADGSVSFGNTLVSSEDVGRHIGFSSESVAALFLDMQLIVRDDPLVWDHVGTFSSQKNGLLECVPDKVPRDRGIELGRKARDVSYVKAKRLE